MPTLDQFQVPVPFLLQKSRANGHLVWNLQPGGGLVWDGNLAFEFLGLAAIVRVERWNGRQQCLGVGVFRLPQTASLVGAVSTSLPKYISAT